MEKSTLQCVTPGILSRFSVRSVSTDSTHVPHEGEVSNTNVTPKRMEIEVVPHVGKSILAPASCLTPVTLSLAPMRVNKPRVTFDLLNTKLADSPNVLTATIVVDSAGRLGPALNLIRTCVKFKNHITNIFP